MNKCYKKEELCSQGPLSNWVSKIKFLFFRGTSYSLICAKGHRNPPKGLARLIFHRKSFGKCSPKPMKPIPNGTLSVSPFPLKCNHMCEHASRREDFLCLIPPFLCPSAHIHAPYRTAAEGLLFNPHSLGGTMMVVVAVMTMANTYQALARRQ